MRKMLVRPPEQRPETRHPERGLGARLALGSVLAALVAVPATLIWLLVESEWEPLERLDHSVADGLNDVARDDSGLVDVLEFGSVALEPWVFRAVVVGVGLWLWLRGARRLATWAVVTMAVGGLLGLLLKLLVERARPSFPEPVAVASGYSFPSGHALNSMLGVGVLLLVFLPVLRGLGRALAYLVGAALVLLTGFDRVGLGVHYVSDVVAGWVVALAVLAGTSGAFEIWRREHGRAPSTVTEGVEPEAEAELRGEDADPRADH